MRTFRIPLLVAAAAAAVLLTGCAQDKGGNQLTSGTNPSPEPSYVINPDTASDVVETEEPANQGGDVGGQDQLPGDQGGPAGPMIDLFRVAQQPSCPSGTDAAYQEGKPVKLEWKVTGADKITISVDGPGVYDTFDPEGSHEFSFPCSGDAGMTVKHTYLLKTVGGGGDSEKTLTVSAKVNEITRVLNPSPAP